MEKHQEKAINKQLLQGWAIIAVVLSICYALEMKRGIITLPYFLMFLPMVILPFLACFILYRMNPGTIYLKYVGSAGYLLMYVFVLATSKTNLIFAFIFPLLSLLILYHNKRIIILLGLLALAADIAFIFLQVSRNNLDLKTSADAELQVCVLVLVFVFCGMAAGLYEDIHKENLEYTVALNEKSKELEDMTLQTITAIAGTIDAKDSYTEGHSSRVAQYSRALAKSLGKNEEECQRIYNIALLHDIGKIGVPDSVLHKPGRLTPEEYELVRQHPTIGAKILRGVKAFPGLEIGALYHHERYDGAGYPEGLSGKNIPEEARIICVADTFDAMNTNRVYRKRFKKDAILEELERCSGSQFDPEIAKKMQELLLDGTIDELEKKAHQNDRRHFPDESEEELPLAELSSLLISKLTDEHSEKYLLDSLADKETFSLVEQDIINSLKTSDGCMLLIDVDEMGEFNRSHGLLQGDFVLAEIAQVLISTERQMPVCRLEGDEFLCYINEIRSTDEAKAAIRALRGRIRERLSREGDPGVTFSIGASVSAATGRKFSSLLYAAEKALQNVKQNGKDSFIVYTQGGMDMGAPDEDALQKDLDNITAVIEHRDSYNGAMKVEFKDFGQVYELLRNIGIRNAQTLQLVLFTVEFGNDADIHISERSQVMQYLDKAITNSVRKVDVTTRYSSTQQLALFSNLPEENLHVVTDRIMKEFYCMVSESKFQLVYSYRTINFQDDK